MSTTPHPVVPEEIMVHLDGELSAARAQSISAHIESCAACREVVTSLRNTSHSLSSWTVAPAPVNARFAEHLSAAVAKAPSNSHRLKFQILPSQRWKLLTTSAVLAVLLIVTIGWRGGQYHMTVDQARVAVARHTQEQEAIVARLPEGDGTKSQAQDRWFLAPPSGPLASPMASAGLAGKAAPAEVNRPELYAKVQRPIDAQTAAPMIARTVSLSIVAKDFDSARASLDAILVRHSGYAANLNVATPQGAARMLQASLRIPAQQLSVALTELKSLGRVELETQNGEEVTQQHADLVARLKNSRETEQRLQAILTQRTGKISDVLEVEQEIARVRGEIEQMEAEQKSLEHRVDFATIDLKLSEEYKAKLDSPTPAISTLIHNAAVNGYRNVADTLLSIILFFAEYGPVLIFWLFLFFIPAWLVWRRWRHAAAI
jgi:anti-sigma factor RsiW